MKLLGICDRADMKDTTSTMMPALTMNQAKDLTRDGKQRPVERGTALKVVGAALEELDKFIPEEEDLWQKKEEEALEKKSKKKAFRSAQKAETAGIKSSQKHSMKTRGKPSRTINQPGKFGRDLQRHF